MNAEEQIATARRRIADARATQAEVLYLGDLSLLELPDDFYDMPHLKVLAFGVNEPIQTEAGLKWTYHDGTSGPTFSKLPPLDGLTALITLDLEKCGSLTNVDGLQHLTQLTSLDLSECS